MYECMRTAPDQAVAIPYAGTDRGYRRENQSRVRKKVKAHPENSRVNKAGVRGGQTYRGMRGTQS